MKKIYYVLVIIILLFIACEKSTEVEIEIPFKEEYVVQGKLQANRIFEGVTITKTYPINETSQNINVDNAVGYIVENGIKTVPIHSQGQGLYKPMHNYLILPGTQYELYIDIEGDRGYSRTIVPNYPLISDIKYRNGHYLETEVNADLGTAIGALWYHNLYENNSINFYEINKIDSEDKLIRTNVIPENARVSDYINEYGVRLFSFDEAFRNFFESFQASKPVEDQFVQGSGSVSWNVFGDNMTGLFIGFTDSIYFYRPDSIEMPGM